MTQQAFVLSGELGTVSRLELPVC